MKNIRKEVESQTNTFKEIFSTLGETLCSMTRKRTFSETAQVEARPVTDPTQTEPNKPANAPLPEPDEQKRYVRPSWKTMIKQTLPFIVRPRQPRFIPKVPAPGAGGAGVPVSSSHPVAANDNLGTAGDDRVAGAAEPFRSDPAPKSVDPHQRGSPGLLMTDPDQDEPVEPPAKKNKVVRKFLVYWDKTYERLREFVEENGRYPTREDPDSDLFRWSVNQKYMYKDYEVKEPRKHGKLGMLPMWDKFVNEESRAERRKRQWQTKYDALKNFVETSGKWPKFRTELGTWLYFKRDYYRTHPDTPATKWQLSELSKLPGWEKYSTTSAFSSHSNGTPSVTRSNRPAK